MAHVVIIGAGISGLALAFRLHQRRPDATITVLERDDRPGGKIWTHRDAGFVVEAGPNGFPDSKPSTIALCKDLGLEGQLVAASDAASANRYLFHDDQFRLLPSGLWSFLTSSVLSWRGKLDLLLERWRDRPAPAGDESIDAFARRRAGAEVAEVLADAVVTGIQAGDPHLLSLPAAFPRIATLEREHGSVLKGLAVSARQRRAEARARGEAPQRLGRMWSCRSGLGVLIETLAERLPSPAVLGVGVRRVVFQSDGQRASWRVEADGRDAWTADAVVLTCPAYQQAALLADLDGDLAEQLARIAYNRVVVVALGYRRADVPHALDGFGWIAPQRTRRDVLGVQWCSSIFPERAPSGAVLLRAIGGGWNRPDIAGWDDARLLDAMRAEMRLALGITAAPIMHRIIRWDRAIPQYHIGHLVRIAAIEQRAARFPGLFVGGNALHGVAMNDCTEQAEVLAERVSGFVDKACG